MFFRKFKNLGISGSFAKWYDKNTRENRLGEMRAYAQEALKFLSDQHNCLEIAPGPGYFSIELAKMGNFNITGMDISKDFIEICKNNASRENLQINFVVGNVSEMPFEDNSFEFIFCSAAFKNFKESVKALQEMYRVLKENCTCLIMDMNPEVSSQELLAEATKISKSGFERWFMKNTFKQLCKSAHSKSAIEKMLQSVPFPKFEIILKGIGLNIYLHK
jgi:ubiquinone/menaquinone biosynthesis C-methylase UbiE